MLVAYILIETFDSYALVVGKLFGKRPAFPVLSPRKTIEGLLGGAVFLVLTVVVVAAVMDASILFATALALLAGILGLAGICRIPPQRRGGVRISPWSWVIKAGRWIFSIAGLPPVRDFSGDCSGRLT